MRGDSFGDVVWLLNVGVVVATRSSFMLLLFVVVIGAVVLVSYGGCRLE